MQKKFINKNFLPTEYINDKVMKDSKDEKQDYNILITQHLSYYHFH